MPEAVVARRHGRAERRHHEFASSPRSRARELRLAAPGQPWRRLRHPGPARRRYSTPSSARPSWTARLPCGDVRVVGLVRAADERRDVGAVAARFLSLLAAAAVISATAARRRASPAARRQGFPFMAVFSVHAVREIALQPAIPHSRASAFAARGVAWARDDLVLARSLCYFFGLAKSAK